MNHNFSIPGLCVYDVKISGKFAEKEKDVLCEIFSLDHKTAFICRSKLKQ